MAPDPGAEREGGSEGAPLCSGLNPTPWAAPSSKEEGVEDAEGGEGPVATPGGALTPDPPAPTPAPGAGAASGALPLVGPDTPPLDTDPEPSSSGGAAVTWVGDAGPTDVTTLFTMHAQHTKACSMPSDRNFGKHTGVHVSTARRE